MKSDIQSHIMLIAIIGLIIVFQGFVVHASQDFIQNRSDLSAYGITALDLLKHYP